MEKMRPPLVTELLLTNDGDQILEGSVTNFFIVRRKACSIFLSFILFCKSSFFVFILNWIYFFLKKKYLYRSCQNVDLVGFDYFLMINITSC